MCIDPDPGGIALTPPPNRRRATDTHGTLHIFACQATEEGNLLHLLQTCRFRPSTQHDSDATGFYAQGFETSGSVAHDMWHTAQVIDKTYHLDKNRAGVVLHCIAWRTGK